VYKGHMIAPGIRDFTESYVRLPDSIFSVFKNKV